MSSWRPSSSARRATPTRRREADTADARCPARGHRRTRKAGRAMNQVFDNLASDPTVGAIGLALAGAAAGLWLAAAWWAYTDMGRRTTLELVRLMAVAWI